MLERVRVEVGVQFAVDDVEDVPVELGGDPGRVVVGADEASGVLDEVGAEEEEVTVVHGGADAAEEPDPLGGRHVADRPAEEGDEAPLAAGQEGQVLLVVGDDGPDGQVRMVGGDPGGGLFEELAAHVDRYVGAEGAGEGVEQEAGLPRSGAEFEEGLGAGGGGDVGCVHDEDLPFAAGRVVLLQFGDLLEERAAALVIEPLGRQGLGRAGEPSRTSWRSVLARSSAVRNRSTWFSFRGNRCGRRWRARR